MNSKNWVCVYDATGIEAYPRTSRAVARRQAASLARDGILAAAVPVRENWPSWAKRLPAQCPGDHLNMEVIMTSGGKVVIDLPTGQVMGGIE